MKKDYYSQYRFTKEELLKNPLVLLSFIKLKTNELITLLSIEELLIVLLSFLFPLFLMIYFKKIIKKKWKTIKFFLSQVKKPHLTLPQMPSLDFSLERVHRSLLSNYILVVVILLLITLFSRFFISYTDKGNMIISPDSVLAQPTIGADFLVGVIFPADSMFRGKNMYAGNQNYGSAFTLLTVPFIYIASSNKICATDNLTPCHFVFYHWLIFITIAGYLLFILLVSIKMKHLLSFLLLFFTIFILSLFGSFGLERGNIDIILSLILGCLILLITYKPNKEKKKFDIFKSIIVGFVSAFFVNSKFFLLPIGLSAVYSSKRIPLSLLSFIAAFIIFGYLPNFLYNSPSDPLSSINTALVVGHVDTFHHSYRLQYNYSFSAIASLATNCVQKKNCRGSQDSLVISTISLLLFLFTFIYPFVGNRIIRKKLLNWSIHVKKRMENGINLMQALVIIKLGIKRILKERMNKYFTILLFILSNAALILVPEQTYPYRLYYSLPLLVILWRETEKNMKARLYCLLSIIFLSIKGFWILNDINPAGFNIFEARGMVIFVILSFYFMIKASLELMVTEKVKL
ncbi:MAG: hypothetical protein M1365_13175 [Actinobacteria bacterium]|nr:hypothetical protein [Actinomycetota bacterium]